MSRNQPAQVIMHNSVSLDGSFVNFEYSPEFMGLHYEIAGNFGETIRLFGSNTARVSMEMFSGFTPESSEDFHKPQKAGDPSPWVVVDSKAILKDKLHYFRRSEYCRDIAVLVAQHTCPEYLDYLKTRNYDYFVAGEDQVDLRTSVEWMVDRFGIGTIMVDSGSGLTNAMLNQGLVDRISLLVLPTVIGQKGENLFRNVARPLRLSLIKQQAYPAGHVWSLYAVEDRQ
jgi:2,5-diamino-6-(ribosylamino)-4(3H)-pyrimidinone 5'-phosphate reductase